MSDQSALQPSHPSEPPNVAQVTSAILQEIASQERRLSKGTQRSYAVELEKTVLPLLREIVSGILVPLGIHVELLTDRVDELDEPVAWIPKDVAEKILLLLAKLAARVSPPFTPEEKAEFDGVVTAINELAEDDDDDDGDDGE